MKKKKIAMLMSAVMILSGTAMPSEMTYAMDDIQISAEEETDEAGSSEESEPEDQETDVEEDADDFGDDSLMKKSV